MLVRLQIRAAVMMPATKASEHLVRGLGKSGQKFDLPAVDE